MATITNYIDLVTVLEAKSYLRIDASNTDSDVELAVMIGSACNLIENYTQVYLRPRDEVYYFNSEGYIRLYPKPVNSIELPVTATDYDESIKQLYRLYSRNNSSLESMTFNLGYDDTADVKPIFKTAILETVKLWFYGSEDEAVLKGGYLPNSVMAILSSERRFIF